MTWRGGERVLHALSDQWPGAPIYTLVADRRKLPAEFRAKTIHTSWLQRCPGRRAFRWALPLFPAAVEAFTLPDCDAVISVSHAVAKGIRPRGIPHLCYCLTPMRYAWVDPERYFGPRVQVPGSWQNRLVRDLRRWDADSAQRVDRFVAISETVRARIRSCYGREADVVYPPVVCAPFEAAARNPQGYHLVVSALVPYKRVDLAITAFNRLRMPLVIIGEGPETPRLRRLAGPTITFRPWQTRAALARWYAEARALIYSQEEDFGIAAVEAQAAGCPVIAFRKGGATETVLDGVTGTFFEPHTAEALADAVLGMERAVMDPAVLRRHARRFDRARFERAFHGAVAALRADGRR